MQAKLLKLLNVKSIVTIALTLVFCYLSVVGKVDTANFMNIFQIVIVFYFGTQVGSKEVIDKV